MTKLSAPAQTRLADMGRQEAEQITTAIKDNFDSLGAMLIQARDRKAYRALGYRSFESYCQTEFGKSVSSAYQLIEDAKVLNQLEERISKNYGEEVTLNFPSSHLKAIKAVEDIDDKLKVIQNAQKLAAAQNRKATKKDLEIAVFQFSGKPSEDLKKAIEGLGFVKGTPVEVESPIKKDRGVVKNIDKSGIIYVELYYDNSVKAMPFRSQELRILTDKEKPTNPLDASTACKGDRVRIFAQDLEGKEGTIFTWNESKQALVIIDGEKTPTSIAYAEMEKLQAQTHWQAECAWNRGKNVYYYLPEKNKIYSDLWPTTLSIEACTHSETTTKFLTPAEFVEDWENKYAKRILEGLATPERVKELALAQATELPGTQAKEFASDLIATLRHFFWDELPGSPTSLLVENQRLQEQLTKTEIDRDNLLVKIAEAQNKYISIRKLEVEPLEDRINNLESEIRAIEKERIATSKELKLTIDHSKQGFFQQEISKIALANEILQSRLTEAEATIEAMVRTHTEISVPGDTAAHSDFSVENTSETSAPGQPVLQPEFSTENTKNSVPEDDTERNDTWKEILEANKFVPIPHRLKGEFKGYWRGWKFFFHIPPQDSLAYPAGRRQERKVTIIDLTNEEKEMFTRAIQLDGETKIIEWVKGVIDQIVNTDSGLPLDILTRIEVERENANERINSNQSKKYDLYARKGGKSDKKEIERLDKDVDAQYNKIEKLNKFSQFRLGQTICHRRNPLILGKIIHLEFSQGGMPLIWVRYFRDGELEKTPTSELIEMIYAVDTHT